MDDQQFDGLERPLDRRSFIKKLAVTGAFVVPAVVSFRLDSLARAGGYQSYPNQTYPNQSYPNQFSKWGRFRWTSGTHF